MLMVPPPHPATLEEARLLKQCRITFGRGTGPGGQNRNKVETFVTVRHEPTGIEASAGERRRQAENRWSALRRLRLRLATVVRTRVHPERHRASPLWQQRRQGRQMSINPRHGDYPALLAEALDVIVARGFDVAGAAGVLGLSMSQLARLVRHERQAFALVNQGRRSRGLPALK
jgi:hypothetical protein